MKQALWLIVNLIAIFSSTNLSTISANPQSTQSNSNEDLNIFRGPRHDEFDWSLTKKVLDDSNRNTVFSPFMVKLLLSILLEATGRDTSTHRELLSILPSLSTEEDVRELYAKTFRSLLQGSEDYELNLGAKLLVDKFISPRQKFGSVMKAYYHSDVESVDFARSQEAANMINAWCANVTRNHIKDMVSADDVAHSVILLLNAIYFNGYWTEKFAKSQTTIRNFNVNSNTTSTAQFMSKTANFFYGESIELDSTFLRLPYKGGKFAMYIVLPNQVDGLDDLLLRIDSSNINRMQLLMSLEEVTVSLPKFNIVNTVKFNEILKSLGIRQMFTNQASFPELIRGNLIHGRLTVSSILQKTGIEVNEEGSATYANTDAILVNNVGVEIEFNADRPFLFFIIDETTGTLIFSGKFVRPDHSHEESRLTFI